MTPAVVAEENNANEPTDRILPQCIRKTSCWWLNENHWNASWIQNILFSQTQNICYIIFISVHIFFQYFIYFLPHRNYFLRISYKKAIQNAQKKKLFVFTEKKVDNYVMFVQPRGDCTFLTLIYYQLSIYFVCVYYIKKSEDISIKCKKGLEWTDIKLVVLFKREKKTYLQNRKRKKKPKYKKII